MTDLVLYVAGPDLPTKWDGRGVEWRGWTNTPTFVCRRRRKRNEINQCSGCKSQDHPMVNLGVLAPEPGATFTVQIPKRAPSGKTYFKDVTKAAWPIVDLVAFRCTGCGLDSVWQMSTNLFWDLDPGDYGPQGSAAPEQKDS